MADVNFNERFSPAEATRGSWVPIDGTTIAGGIPSASRGKYTQLNYIVGSEPGALSLALSGGTVILPVSAVNISEPLEIENKIVGGLPVPLDVDITASVPLTVSNNVDVTLTNDLTGIITNNVDTTVTNVVSTTNIDLSNTTQMPSQTIAANASAVITFAPEVNHLEIYNKDINNVLYLAYNTALPYITINNLGLPIEAEAYYSIDRTISSLVITNPNGSTTDVVVFGHYKV